VPNFIAIQLLDEPGDRFSLTNIHPSPWYEVVAPPEPAAPGMIAITVVRIDTRGTRLGVVSQILWPKTFQVNGERRLRTLQVRCVVCRATFEHTQNTANYNTSPERIDCGRHGLDPTPVERDWAYALCRIDAGIPHPLAHAEDELSALRLFFQYRAQDPKECLTLLAAVDTNGQSLHVPVTLAWTYDDGLSVLDRGRTALRDAGFAEDGRDLLAAAGDAQ
jgi:hypothetical protein